MLWYAATCCMPQHVSLLKMSSLVVPQQIYRWKKDVTLFRYSRFQNMYVVFTSRKRLNKFFFRGEQ